LSTGFALFGQEKNCQKPRKNQRYPRKPQNRAANTGDSPLCAKLAPQIFTPNPHNQQFYLSLCRFIFFLG
jgi:hypothetical protein